MNIIKSASNRLRTLYAALALGFMTLMVNMQAQIVAYDGTNVTFAPSGLVDDVIDAIVTGITAMTALWLLTIGFRKIMGFIRRG